MNAKQPQQIKEQLQSGPVRRVVVVLDVTTECGRALSSGVALASGLQSGLVALFADGQSLSRLEGHPMVRSIDLATGRGGGFGPGSMQRGVKAMARRTQRRLGILSKRHRIDARFEVVGGDIRQVLEAKTGPQDLLVVESSGRSVAGSYRLPSSGREIVRGLGSSALFVDKTHRPVRSATLLYDGSEAAKRGLMTALRLGGRRRVPLITVLFVGTSKEEVQGHRQELRQMVQAARRPVRIHGRRITHCATSQILTVSREMGSDLLILPGGATFEGEADLERLIEESPSPVLVFRD